MKVLGVYGASGFGREVLPIVRANIDAAEWKTTRLVFVDDGMKAEEVNSHRVMSYQEFIKQDADEKHLVFAIAASEIRQRLVERAERDGVSAVQVFAKNSLIMDEVDIALGAVVCPFVTLTSNIRIGQHFHANIYSYVAHDCIVGDYVTFAPAVRCNGNVIIEDHVYVGTGAVIKQGRPDDPLIIGRGAVIGMGAVVTKSVAAGTTVVGNPARLLER